MKTLKGWESSNLDLGEYLGEEPCEIDEELSLYIGEIVPPQYLGWDNGLTQGGDPDRSIEGEDEIIYTFMTCRRINGKEFYLGILPEFKQ